MSARLVSRVAVALVVTAGFSAQAASPDRHGHGSDMGTGGHPSGAAVTAGGAPSSAWMVPPPVAAALAAPAGASPALHAHAEGAQIYKCTAATGAGAATWQLKAPDATLYDATGARSGTHGAGPVWTSSDGSSVRGAKVAEVAAPVPGAIPWLLLRASSASGAGVLGNVTYVQRLNTAGGVAPAGGCDKTTVGTEVRVRYTAEYYFYRGGTALRSRDEDRNVLALHLDERARGENGP